jgi:hypothetical protein
MPPSQPTLYEEPRVSPDGWNAPDPQQGGWNNPPDQGSWNNPSVDPQQGGWAASQRDNFPASRVGDGGSLKMPPSGHRPSKPLADVSQITGSYRPSQNNLTNGGGGGYPNPGDLDNSTSMSGRRGPSQPAFGNGGGGAGAGAGGGSPNWGSSAGARNVVSSGRAVGRHGGAAARACADNL